MPTRLPAASADMSRPKEDAEPNFVSCNERDPDYSEPADGEVEYGDNNHEQSECGIELRSRGQELLFLTTFDYVESARSCGHDALSVIGPEEADELRRVERLSSIAKVRARFRFAHARYAKFATSSPTGSVMRVVLKMDKWRGRHWALRFAFMIERRSFLPAIHVIRLPGGTQCLLPRELHLSSCPC